MDKNKYFIELYNYAMEFYDALPIERTPQPLDYSLNKLKPRIETLKQQEIAKLKLLRKIELNKPGDTNTAPSGLNTIGMLVDRFTILLFKEWCLRNKNNNPTKGAEIYKTQTVDIISAMATCRPGNSSMNTKVTNIKVGSTASSWEESFYGLLSINLILWESQEVLYIKDISILPCEELRDYLKWFSWGNMIRNEFIQLCEEYFWK